jgi:hypothetical protein
VRATLCAASPPDIDRKPAPVVRLMHAGRHHQKGACAGPIIISLRLPTLILIALIAAPFSSRLSRYTGALSHVTPIDAARRTWSAGGCLRGTWRGSFKSGPKKPPRPSVRPHGDCPTPAKLLFPRRPVAADAPIT